jgi:uncharacterized protein YecA (UPF0149 family)
MLSQVQRACNPLFHEKDKKKLSHAIHEVLAIVGVQIARCLYEKDFFHPDTFKPTDELLQLFVNKMVSALGSSMVLGESQAIVDQMLLYIEKTIAAFSDSNKALSFLKRYYSPEDIVTKFSLLRPDSSLAFDTKNELE